ncbi:MAG: diguanylate cyclase [Solirubrobacterales bacterium]
MEEKRELINELIKYQELSEDTIQKLNSKIVDLENKLAIFTSVLSISEYINQYYGSDKIISLINDMLIGVMGAAFSSIYVKENGRLVLRESNLEDAHHHKVMLEESSKNSYSEFLINSSSNLYTKYETTIHSSLGIPIAIKGDLLGFIIVEHENYNFFNEFHTKFIKAIGNQIAICFENNKLYNKIMEISNRDYLTGLFNRNYFYKKVSKYLSTIRNDIAIAMIDFDNFKNCNDNYGHLYGDQVLITISSLVKENMDGEDIVCRYGGEELIICMFNVTDIEVAEDKMNKIRKLVEQEDIIYGDICDRITVSIGVSVFDKGDKVLEDVIRKADNMLYIAKRTGKNKVKAWDIQ